MLMLVVSSLAWLSAVSMGVLVLSSRGGRAIALDTVTYYRALVHYLVKGGRYEGSERLFEGYEEATRIRVSVFSLCLALKLWDEPHYRKSSYAADVRDNFRNVALPGTGVPLSVLAMHKVIAWSFVWLAYPACCLAAAIADSRRTRRAAHVSFREQLLAPRDWFSLWRINSRLSAYHSLATRARHVAPEEGWHDYGMENKWLFLEKGLKLGVPVSPILDVPKLCIKHRNEEGGMGIHFYENALNGGDWIVQEVLSNEDSIAELLPGDAPLSTFRVMTASMMGRHDLKHTQDVVALSCVFRAGRAGARTDHKSVLFDVDCATGEILAGTTNSHWYQIGKIAGVPWGPPKPMLDHPDTGTRLAGKRIPDFRKRVLDVAVKAHQALLPRVPIAGWDVVLAKGHGPCLLEVNLSCNFFRGSFDPHFYFDFVDKCFLFCEARKPL
mmetsp:Transcript_20238/g.63605  ORF Transcript_20238/g.63605 Transcript_20238/m.63605 type:complete len:440 (-) Transcript_20238:292-1611(-)|eukprot:CAMPEP_0197395672 /NCGR_PEP_ID=MMETSP1165-20131217/7204_1 /TAXON_ID=284809 /ORGANISM="Chrysocystis fragilis, Strain CCMP3189" /LENGTH=439 /DNA_ID=CAMNT_0042921441 /DNA_START=19 /DNA_END=1338 /DNA_ORIENTATION=+